MAENKKSELASKIGELFKEIYNLVNEEKKNGAKVGVIACFSNRIDDGIEGSWVMSGTRRNCSDALSEIVSKDPELIKITVMKALGKDAFKIKPSISEEKAEDENNDGAANDKFDKAADEIANIIKGLKED